MKKIIYTLLLLLFAFSSCQDENEIVSTTGLLVAVKKGDQLYQSFTYSNSKLSEESFFQDFCDTPLSEFTYSYDDSKLIKLRQTERGLYSSTATMCDPQSGIKAEVTFDYDLSGRIKKVNHSSSYEEWTYNGLGQIAESTLYANDVVRYKTTYQYDSRGNLISITDQSGNETRYEYDDKINPYFLINQRPHWISAFNKSPNNVIKATGASQFERSFKYTTSGLPTEVLEPNGATYFFIYQ